MAVDGALSSVQIATWDGGTTVHSVVVPDTGAAQHEYWVVRDGQVLARCASLAAVDDWAATTWGKDRDGFCLPKDAPDPHRIPR